MPSLWQNGSCLNNTHAYRIVYACTKDKCVSLGKRLSEQTRSVGLWLYNAKRYVIFRIATYGQGFFHVYSYFSIATIIFNISINQSVSQSLTSPAYAASLGQAYETTKCTHKILRIKTHKVNLRL